MSQADDADRVAHVFLTRFNLPTPGPESLVRAQEGWLRIRWELFTRFTVPSMRAQSEQRFTWLVYFDAESPEWLRAAIGRHAAERLYIPLFRQEAPVAQVVSDIRRFVAPRPELLTTNLDNDDGLAVDFVARLQAHRTPHDRSAVYLTHGLIRNGEALYLRTDRDNAFCSVRELWDDPMTCWRDWHVLLHKHMPVSEIGGAPAWLQLVHSTNVSNRVHGRLVRPADYRDVFPGLIDDAQTPSTRRLLLDRTVLGPARVLRDTLRALLKCGILRLGGKEALDRLKSFASQPRRGHGRSSMGGAA